MTASKENTTLDSDKVNDYDAVPYISYPYPNTDPEQLYTISKLFALTPTDPNQAKMLELGCASGGNILPMALRFPESQFIGVDLSEKQIEEANKHTQKLGVNNLTFQNISILDIDENFGKFDYIIVHGILSWVPQEVQDKIFQIFKTNLTENGIAYVSYNTLPGWNAIRSIREMMLYHTSNFSDPKDKAREARLLLNFIKSGNEKSENNIYSDFIQKEIDLLKNMDDSYIMHDHLEENNEPFYFHDIVAKARANDLDYLSDTNLSSMFTGNFPQEITEVLRQVQNDIVRTEQYMDFIRNRRFRASLFCHAGSGINRAVSTDNIKDFYISTKLRPEQDPQQIDTTSGNTVKFISPDGASLNTSNSIMITSMIFLAEHGMPIHINNFMEEVKQRITDTPDQSELEKLLFENFLVMLFTGGIRISSFEPQYTISVSETPKASDLARYQSTYDSWVTNQRSEKVTIDIYSRVLIQYVNGSNNFDTIAEKMAKHVLNGEININKDGTPITDEQVITDKIRELTEGGLKQLANSALLVS